MRIKLVLLAVGALVFAPGWNGAGPPPSHAEASDLAGRILAPTFDEASRVSHADGPSYKLEHDKLRAGHGKELVSAPPEIELPPYGYLWVPVLTAILLSALAGHASNRSARAPPYLLTI